MIYFSHASNGIRITWTNDSQCAYSVLFPTVYAQFNITTTVVMGTNFGQHAVIFYFRFPQGCAVVGEDDQFHFAVSDHFQSLLVPQQIHCTFHKSWSLEWINSSDSFVFFAPPISCLRYRMTPSKNSYQNG